MFAFFLISIIFRCAGDTHERIMHSKVTYALSLLIAYLRLLETFYVSKVLGPKIVAIQNMVSLSFFFFLVCSCIWSSHTLHIVRISAQRFAGFHLFVRRFHFELRCSHASHIVFEDALRS